MYRHIINKFNVNALLISKLADSNQEYQELFRDYESTCLLIEKYESDLVMYKHYQELLKELEEEIADLLSGKEQERKTDKE